MADTDIAGQLQHMPLVKNVAYQPVALALVNLYIIPGYDACRVLTAMLHDGQGIVQRLVYRLLANDSYNAAHNCSVI
jgi:hypothetical protein